VSAFRFIAAEKANHPISVMCRMLEVSASGFHAWQRRPPSDRTLSDAWLLERIREIHHANRGVYGAPRCTPSCGSLMASASGTNGWSG
jgi:putative transposase